MTTIHRLHLSDVAPAARLPWTRPPFPVYGYLILHESGPILFDTGVGIGNALIDSLYSPVHHDLDEALLSHGVSVADICTIIVSHLHFDHCGQNARFRHARILVQRAEIEAAKTPRYTVLEWAFPPGIDLIAADGDYDVAPGVRIIATPGHTPGHQSLLVVEDAERTILVGQAAFDAASFGAGMSGDAGGDAEIGAASLRKLHALAPTRALLSHGHEEWRGQK